jgi:hypothetical protein
MLTSTEPTFEGLTKQFHNHQPSLGIFASEGGQFIGGHAMNEENKLRTASGLSDLWDIGEARRVRAGEGASVFSGRRVAVHLMVQPEVATVLLSDSLLLGQGLLSRILVTAPDSAAGTRFSRDEQPETDAAIIRYGANLLDILERPLPVVAGTVNELEPRALPLSKDAQAVWKTFADHIERSIGVGGDLETIKGLANKLPEHAARLAGVLALYENINAPEVTTESMQAGIRLAEHYAFEAVRVFEVSRINTDLLLAKRLLKWLQGDWGESVISLPDIYQKGPNAIREKATARRMVGILVDHGWLIPVPDGAAVAGHHRREAWRIIKL